MKITTTKEIDITPEELAECFWGMDDEEQGKFFSALTKIDFANFEGQMWYARQKTSEAGRAYLKIMAGVEA